MAKHVAASIKKQESIVVEQETIVEPIVEPVVVEQEVKYTLAISMQGFQKGQIVKPTDFTEKSFSYWLKTGAIIKK